ncbi:SMI1/KNR4 family protein [Pseudomonas kitaguniensis]|uniref:SMI1/KNR4 family protein n=1 Tax=Pseudomonas kitaguniensis TaxID=2607908 RepID=UPI003D05F22B
MKVDADISVADEDRYVDLDIIYGLNRDSNNIFLKNSVYKDRIGEDFYTFGESASGDQYCIERESGKIYYWHHEAKHESEIKFLIAPNLIEFITHLIADEEKPLIDKTKKIISATFDF